MEVRKVNEGIVADRKTLAELLAMASPSATTKGGKEFAFRKEVLQQPGERLPGDLQRRLRLPILFFQSPDVAGSCSCSDPAAFAALQALGEISPLRTLEGGKFWVGRAIAYAILRKYPAAVQIVMGA